MQHYRPKADIASARRWATALYTPSDGSAEPERATAAIANAARRAGTAVLERCAVRGIETAAGAVSGVVTEKGAIRCGQVVLAGGVWSSLFCGNLGIRFPQLKILGSVMRIAPIAGCRRRQLRLPQAARRWLHRRPAQCQHRRDRAG